VARARSPNSRAKQPPPGHASLFAGTPKTPGNHPIEDNPSVPSLQPRPACDPADDQAKVVATYEKLESFTHSQFDALTIRLPLAHAHLLGSQTAPAERARNIIDLMRQQQNGLQQLHQAIGDMLDRATAPAGSQTPVMPTQSAGIRIYRTNTTTCWTGVPRPDHLVETCWGKAKSEAVHPTPTDVVFSLLWMDDAPLAEAMARLAVHGGTRRLFVDENEEWSQRVARDTPGCIGASNCPWRPEILDAVQAPSVLSPTVEVDSAHELATMLQSRMDQWTLDRVSYLLWKSMSSVENAIRFLHFQVHADFLVPIKQSWESWQSQMAADAVLREHFLRGTLATSAQKSASRVRIGPRTIEPCLLPAVVFALAIGVATGRGTKPLHDVAHAGVDDLVRNLTHGAQAAHLLGLELVEQQKILLKFGEIQWPSGYAFLARAENSVRELIEQGRRLSSRDLERERANFKNRDYGHVTIFTCDQGFMNAVADGPAALNKYIRELATFQANLNEERVSRTLSQHVAVRVVS
jgi:hypothetical protein